jgi:hypothetical protein
MANVLRVFFNDYSTPCDQLLDGFTEGILESGLQLRLQKG